MSMSSESTQVNSLSKSAKVNYKKKINEFKLYLRANNSGYWDNGSEDVVLSRITTDAMLKSQSI